jgi:hypothetical protein
MGTGFILWMLYGTIQKNKAAFSRENISNSIFTLGILALFLIGFIFLLVKIL